MQTIILAQKAITLKQQHENTII